MAARSEASLEDIVELRHVAADDLEPLLREETEIWRQELAWDFAPSAELVRRFVRMRALSGCVLRDAGTPIGYCYYVPEEHKGLIGGLYVRRSAYTPERERRLLSSVLQQMLRLPGLRRIESQLMMLRSASPDTLPYYHFGHTYARYFMLARLPEQSLQLDEQPSGIVLERWHENLRDEAARLIADSYRQHIDSQINDQYRSASGAQRFLLNIVEYPGCGQFYAPASSVARLTGSGKLCGLVLTSAVASDVGHVTQVCVSPQMRGHGVGQALLRHALATLRRDGFERASLTVTAANEEAVQLYTKLGFVVQRHFHAHVWEGW